MHVVSGLAFRQTQQNIMDGVLFILEAILAEQLFRSTLIRLPEISVKEVTFWSVP